MTISEKFWDLYSRKVLHKGNAIEDKMNEMLKLEVHKMYAKRTVKYSVPALVIGAAIGAILGYSQCDRVEYRDRIKEVPVIEYRQPPVEAKLSSYAPETPSRIERYLTDQQEIIKVDGKEYGRWTDEHYNKNIKPAWEKGKEIVLIPNTSSTK